MCVDFLHHLSQPRSSVSWWRVQGCPVRTKLLSLFSICARGSSAPLAAGLKSKSPAVLVRSKVTGGEKYPTVLILHPVFLLQPNPGFPANKRCLHFARARCRLVPLRLSEQCCASSRATPGFGPRLADRLRNGCVPPSCPRRYMVTDARVARGGRLCFRPHHRTSEDWGYAHNPCGRARSA